MRLEEISMADFIGTDKAIELFDEYALEAKIEEVPDHNPDVNMFKKLEELNMIYTVAAFMLKYSVPGAVVENIFVQKQHRSSGAGIKIIRRLEEEARSRDAVTMFLSAPIGGSLDRIAESFGFNKTNTTYSKALK